MNTPLVSVIIPAYNVENYIEQAIRSVLAQTLQNLELVIVDDNSSDGTAELVTALAQQDSRIRFFPQSRNTGPGGARNAAIDQARGEWVALLDADDWYEPDRLERLVNAADLAGAPISADNQRFITTADGSWRHLLVNGENRELLCLNADDLLQGDHLHRNARNLGLLKPVVKRAFLKEHGIRYEDHIIALGEDFYFLLECLLYTPQLILVTAPLYNYRTYYPMTYSKQQSVERYRTIRKLHARYQVLFTHEQTPTTALLMEKRRLEIERYIRFKQFAEPLKHCQARTFLGQAFRDPGGLLLLMWEAIRDPMNIVLLFRRFAGNARTWFTGTLQRMQNTSLGS